MENDEGNRKLELGVKISLLVMLLSKLYTIVKKFDDVVVIFSSWIIICKKKKNTSFTVFLVRGNFTLNF
jgi:hypothetical protein